jgi:hypothetical protein
MVIAVGQTLLSDHGSDGGRLRLCGDRYGCVVTVAVVW